MPPSPKHICAVCRNHMCPRSVKREVKDDRKGTLRKLSKQGWMMLSRRLGSHVKAAKGLRKLRLHNTVAHNRRPLQGDGCQPREMKSIPQ